LFYRRLFAASFAAAIAILVPAAKSSAITVSPQVGITSCQIISGVGLPLQDEVGLAVRFQNNASEPLRTIVWRAKYARYVVDFVDDGTFSPGTRIDNYLLSEQGSTHLDWWGLAGDLLAIYENTRPVYSTVKSTVTLPPYVGTEDPENCMVLRTTSLSGFVWVNPQLTQSSVPLYAQLPSSAPSPAAVASPAPGAPPVELRNCQMEFAQKAYLHVSFRNDAPGLVDRVVFRVPFGSSAVDFTDQGTYANGVWVNHRVKQTLPNEQRSRQYVSLDDAAACSVVMVHYADGTSWQNPVAPELGPLPSPVPDAIVLKDRVRWSHSRTVPTPMPSQTPGG
jgi:hypothetical protein